MKRKRSRKSMQASESEYGNADDDDQLPIRKPPRFRFFKIILHASLDQTKLRIPVEFVKKVSYQQDLTPFVTLTVPTGMSWKVIVSKKHNNVYFNEGWAKFMEHNHIQYGYFLDFEYLGNRRFRVYIINLTCCEIQYPTPTHPAALSTHQQVHIDQCQDHANQHFPVKTTSNGIQEDSKASFTIHVRNSHFSGNYLHVPNSFGNKYMRGMGNKFVVKLQADDGREWNVDCYKPERFGFRLNGAEWKNFTQENNWQLGDEYTFTMLSQQGRTHLVLQVTKA